MNPAPIALFVYNRPEETQQTIEALRKNELARESDLFIFSDGARSDLAKPGVDAVREYIHTITGFKSVTITERPENWGLSRSIITGVTDLVQHFGRIIVMEDDLVTTPYFLRYMNDGLNLYENDTRVASLHGFIYPTGQTLPETFFLRGADCWGWATWKRAWDMFEPDGGKLLIELNEKNLTYEFDLDGSYGFTSMLRRQATGQTDSWAIRWHAATFLKNMLTLYPGTSLVDNIGQGSSGKGTHTGATSYKYESLVARPIHVGSVAVVEDRDARAKIVSYFRSRKAGPFVRLGRKIRSWL